MTTASNKHEPERVKGIFSALLKRKPGQKEPDRAYWFVTELEDGRMQMQRLDDNYVPRGKIRHIMRDELFKNYDLEPELWHSLVTKRLSRGDSYREAGQNFEAQVEYAGVVAVDERNIRANFGLGLVYLSMDLKDKAGHVFKTLVEMDEAFESRHKHLFNSFGIALRKQGMFDQAGRFYARAEQLQQGDENLHFNMARLLFESGDKEAAFARLDQTLYLNPDHAKAKAFLRHLAREGKKPKDKEVRARLEKVLAKR